MRADRLVAALLVLQARERVSAAELARELEVSEKTARRDLEALAVAGIPVYAQPGRNGGWSLVGGARTDLSGLTAPEARALFLLAGPAATASPDLKTALRKLVQALPATFRADAAAAASAVVIDPAAWGGRRTPEPPHLDALRRAVVERVQIRIRYRGRDRRVRRRTVHPLGLVQKATDWYLLATPVAAQGTRTYRLDRVESVALTGRPADRPERFDLVGAWQSVAAEVEGRRRRVQAVVRVTPPILAWLRIQFGEDLSEVRQLRDGRVEARIAGSSAEWLADHLAGWGADVEVLRPAELRTALARIGQELVELYAGGRYAARTDSGMG